MCLLIVLRGRFRSHPVLVAGNRDERTDRKASPPGLFVGQHHRAISPRDRVAHGTWLAVGDQGLFAGLTNRAGVPVPEGAQSRGALPHVAIDGGDLDGAVRATTAAVAAAPFAGFRLVLCDGRRTVVLAYDGRQLEQIEWLDELLVLGNEHGPGELELPGLAAAVTAQSTPHLQLAALQPLLLLRGGAGEHAVLKRGEGYGTVSSSLIAVPGQEPRELIWLYAPGPPDEHGYQNYGNLGRRLVREGEDLPRDRLT